METEKKSNGALVGLVIIIIILIIGGIYIWQSKIEQIEKIKDQNAVIIAENAALLEDANALNALEQDLKNTDTNVGIDINTIK